MFSDRIFRTTLIISLVTHGIIFIQNPNLTLFPRARQANVTEISYLKNIPQPQDRQAARIINKEAFLKTPAKIAADKRTPPPFVDKDKIFGKAGDSNSRQGLFTKPTFVKPDTISVRKKITLPPVDLGKISNPSYISYYQIVREKIRRCAYQNYTRTETGEVYLSFIISSEGYIRDVRLIQEKASSSLYLQEIARRSINDASPFPDFPKELDYPQLSFNVVISFEVE